MNTLSAAVCILATAVAVTSTPVEVLTRRGRLGIHRGKDATKGNHPYQVALFADNQFFCSGAIISMNSILTTANCVDWARGDIEVRAGVYKLDDTGKDIQTMTATPADRIIHPNFDLEYLDNDIAIINNLNLQRVENVVEWAKLPTYADAGYNLATVVATVTGWGSVNDDDKLSNVMQVAEITLADTSACVPEYGTGIIGTKLCATTELASTCTGDAGGPAIITVRREYRLLALVSHGSQGGCTQGKPVVFTRVSAFLEFIQDNAQAVSISDN